MGSEGEKDRERQKGQWMGVQWMDGWKDGWRGQCDVKRIATLMGMGAREERQYNSRHAILRIVLVDQRLCGCPIKRTRKFIPFPTLSHHSRLTRSLDSCPPASWSGWYWQRAICVKMWHSYNKCINWLVCSSPCLAWG